MTKYTPIESEFRDDAEEAAHDAWFRAKVDRALAEPGKPVPHEVVMQKAREIIARHERIQASLD